MAKYHDLDIYPKPKRDVFFVNELNLADPELDSNYDLDTEEDNIRIYIPLDINRKAIMRRLCDIYIRYGDPTERNEYAYRCEVENLVSQIEIYDQIWKIREKRIDYPHSIRAEEIVKEMLEYIMDREGCAELYPYDLVESLQKDYSLSLYEL